MFIRITMCYSELLYVTRMLLRGELRATSQTPVYTARNQDIES